MPTLKDYMFAILIGVAWGSSYALSKLALLYSSPMVLTEFRLIIGTLFLYLLIRKRLSISKHDVISGIMNIGGFLILLNLGIALSKNPSLAAVFIYTEPIFALILARVFLGEKTTTLQTIGITLAFIGIIIASGLGDFSYGDIISLAGGFLWAVGTIYYNKYLGNNNTIEENTKMNLVSALFVLPFISLQLHFMISLISIFYLVLVALIAQVLGFWLWFRSVKSLGPVMASTFGLLVPVFSYLFTFLILGEIPTFVQIIGSAITLTGIFFTYIEKIIKIKRY